ncbi:MAG: hypothetical protein JSW50_12335 [Candidatus Latescibacterota bacterium]|nr:MAG: hypothetical protein JSW50_12335 [Candidatus Latescibacterota bacterium]
MSTPKSTRYPWPALELGSPSTSGTLTVWPIIGGDDNPNDYELLSNAVERGTAKVTEVNKGGSVPVIQIENNGKLPLLGIQGEEYVGSKQNRTLNISVLAGQGITQIPVTCVEQGRWDPVMKKFGVGSHEYVRLRYKKSEMVARSRRSGRQGLMRYAADQGEVWSEVHGTSAKFDVRSPTGAMHALYSSGKTGGKIDDIVKGIEIPGDARGVVAAVGGRIEAADIFESPEVFAVLWPRLLKSYAVGALQTRKGLAPSTEAAESFVNTPRSLAWSATPSVGLGEDVRWEDEHHLATALIWDNRFLHASIFAREVD